MGNRNRNKAIQCARVLATLMIALYHYLWRYNELYAPSENFSYAMFRHWGEMGVAFFFFLGGFFAVQSLNDTKELFSYLKKKAISLYPMYACAVIICFIVVSIFGLQNREVSIIDLFLNLICINGFISTPYVDGAHWYMTYLITYTVILGCIALLDVKKKQFAYGVWLVCSLIPMVMSKLHLPGIQVVAIITCGSYIPFIVSGNLLRKFLDNKFDKLTYVLMLVSLILAWKFWDTSVVFFVIISAIYLTAVYRRDVNRKSINIVSRFGDLSYYFYLIHQNIGYVIIAKMERKGTSYILAVLLSLVIVTGMTILLARVQLIIRKGVRK